MDEYINNNYVGAEYVDGINGEESERSKLDDYVVKTDMEGNEYKEGEDFKSVEISAGNVTIFSHNGEKYIVLKEGKVGKGKIKESEVLGITAPSETYEETGINSFIYNEKKGKGYKITGGGTSILQESGFKKNEDNGKFKKDEGTDLEHTEHNFKTTNLNFQETILSNKKSNDLIEGFEITDKANGKRKKVKAIPLNDFKKYANSKQIAWIEKYLKGKSLEKSLEYWTELHRQKVSDRTYDILNIRLSKEKNEQGKIKLIETLTNKVFQEFINNTDYYSMGIDDTIKYLKFLKENKIEGFDFITEKDVSLAKKIDRIEVEHLNHDTQFKITDEDKEIVEGIYLKVREEVRNQNNNG